MNSNSIDNDEVFNNSHVNSTNETDEYNAGNNTEVENSEEDTDYKKLYDEALANAKKVEEIANNQRIRAEKAEAKLKNSSPERTATSKTGSPEISVIDTIALSKANLEPEDIPEVLEYAKFKGISVSEALKSPIIAATLHEKAEYRKTAAAANTGAARRGSTKLSDSSLLENARNGIMPDSVEDIQRLSLLRRKAK